MPSEIRVPFTVHPGIFQVLGGQLVSDKLRAISELVKNAYDADASHVKVNFKDSDEHQITIEDNGNGMDLSTIRNGWLQIGTPLKRMSTVSPRKHRPFSGSMGIGRLSAFSISDEVVL